jgi:flagellar basal body-associated protein FliL
MSSQDNKLLFVALVVGLVAILVSIAIIVTFNSIISDKPTSNGYLKGKKNSKKISKEKKFFKGALISC